MNQCKEPRQELIEIFKGVKDLEVDQCHSEKSIEWWVERMKPPPILPIKIPKAKGLLYTKEAAVERPAEAAVKELSA